MRRRAEGHAEFDPAVDFSTFKTFAIREIKLASANPILNSELVRLWLASRSE